MLPRFIALQKAGKIDFSRKTRLIKETPAHIALDAKNQIGPVALLAMTSQTILKAQSKGIAVGTVRSIIDQGMTSYYAYKAARAGCVALLFSQASNTQSKPLAAAFPRSSGLDPIFLTLDGGSDSSLGLLTLAFAGVLSGNSFSKNLGSTTMIVIDPKVFGEHREITREVSQLSLELKKLAGGGDNRMASDRTMAYKTQCLKHGVPIDSATLETLRGLLQKSLVSKSMISKLA
jgi:LDH2 family malate/lactate/ureidoglycolate dehydrogenase